jgi:hypothetical protein
MFYLLKNWKLKMKTQIVINKPFANLVTRAEYNKYAKGYFIYHFFQNKEEKI